MPYTQLISFHRCHKSAGKSRCTRVPKNLPNNKRPSVVEEECSSWNQQNQTSEEGSCSWLLLSSVCSFYHQPGLRAWCWTCIDCLTDCSFIRQAVRVYTCLWCILLLLLRRRRTEDDDGRWRRTKDVVQMQNTKYVVYFCFFFSPPSKDVKKIFFISSWNSIE